MFKIYVYHVDEKDPSINYFLVRYESDILPQIGDQYVGMEMPDAQPRTVTKRCLYSKDYTKHIIIYVNYTYPNLVPESEKGMPKEQVQEKIN